MRGCGGKAVIIIDIRDEDAPLADAPILLEEQPVPLAPEDSAAKTGDNNTAGAAAAVVAAELGLLGALGAFLRRRKKV